MIVTELLIVFALIVANAVFSGAEIAILALRKARITELAEKGRGNARAVLRLRDRRQQPGKSEERRNAQGEALVGAADPVRVFGALAGHFGRCRRLGLAAGQLARPSRKNQTGTLAGPGPAPFASPPTRRWTGGRQRYRGALRNRYR